MPKAMFLRLLALTLLLSFGGLLSAQEDDRYCNTDLGTIFHDDNECAPCTNNMQDLLQPVLELEDYLEQMKTIRQNLDNYLEEQEAAIKNIARDQDISLGNWSFNDITQGSDISNDLGYIDGHIQEMSAYRRRFNEYPAQSSWMTEWIGEMQALKEMLQKEEELNQKARELAQRLENGEFFNLDSLNYDCCPDAREAGLFSDNQLEGLDDFLEELEALVEENVDYRSDMAESCANFTELMKTSLGVRGADEEEMTERRDDYSDGLLSFLTGKLVDQMGTAMQQLLEDENGDLSPEQEALVQNLSEKLGPKIETALQDGAQGLTTQQATALLNEALGEMSPNDQEAFNNIAGPIMGQLIDKGVSRLAGKYIQSSLTKFGLKAVGGAIELPLALFDKLITVPLYLWADRDLQVLKGAYDRVLLAQLIGLRMTRDQRASGPDIVMNKFFDLLQQGQRNRAVVICLEEREDLPENGEAYANAFLDEVFNGNPPESWANNDHYDLLPPPSERSAEGKNHPYLHYVMRGVRWKVRFGCYCGVYMNRPQKTNSLPPSPAHDQFQPLIPIAEGTGRSSGKVVELQLYNPTGRTVTRQIGPFVTTAREGRQAYVINNTYRVEVPPQSTVSLELYGYCLHRSQDPVPEEENLPDPNRWSTPQTAPPTPTPGSPVSGAFQARPPAANDALQPTYPGTNTPFPYTADMDEGISPLSNYLIDATDRLEAAYDELSESGRIPSVLDNPETQRSAFVQQALWQLTGLLDRDSSYTYEDFKIQYTEAVEEEENLPASALSKEARKSVESRTEDIFSYIQLVGLEAKVLTRPDEADEADAPGYWRGQVDNLPDYSPNAQDRCIQLLRQLENTGSELSEGQKQELQESLHEKFVAITTVVIEAIDCPEAGGCPKLIEQKNLLSSPIVSVHLPPAALDELHAVLDKKAAEIQHSQVAALAPDISGYGSRLAGAVNLPTDGLSPAAAEKLNDLVSKFARDQVPAIDLAAPSAGRDLINSLDVLLSPFAVENLDPALRRPAVDQLRGQLSQWTTAQTERLGMTLPLKEENLFGQLCWRDFVSPYLDPSTRYQITDKLANRASQWMSDQIRSIKPENPNALRGLIDQADLLNNEFQDLLTSTQRDQVAGLLTDGFSQHFLRAAERLNPYDSDFLRDWRHLHMDAGLDYFRAYVPQSTQTEVRNLLQQRAQQHGSAPITLTPDELDLERVALDGRLWKETSPPVVVLTEKGPFPWWWIAAPVAGIGTYLIVTGGDDGGEEPQPPIAVDDLLTVTCAQTATINVLANDSGEGISVTDVSQPAGATVSILSGGNLQISEVGNTGFSFNYTITNQNGLTDIATVTVTVLLPELSPMDDAYTGESGSPLSGNLLENDLGSDLMVTGNSSPAGGVLTLDMDGNFTFQPEDGFCSSTSFTYTVEDVCAQSGEATVSITIQDVTDPQIECPPDIVIACDQDPNDLELTGEATATDNCSAEISIFFTDEISGDACIQQIDRTWLAQDEAGNEASCVQLVQQIDDIAPAIACPDDVTLECDTDLDDLSLTGEATAEDNCSAEVNLKYEDDESGLSGCSGTGELIRTWTATDECGNESQCEQIITLVDETAPVISCPIDITVNCGQQDDLNLTGQAEGTDNCSDDVEITYTDDLGGFSGCEGVIVRNWSATDECGNTISCEQNIVVVPVVCDFEPTFDILPADCGMLNGQISVEVFPPTSNYALEWSNGATGNNLSELPAGAYEVTITDLNANCAQVFPIFVEEIPPEYVIEIITIPASCNQSGDIVLDLAGTGPFTVIITGPETETIPDLPAGTVNLGDLLFLPEGEYFIEVIDQSASPNCTDIVNVEVTYVPAIDLLVESVVDPSSSSAADGSVTLFVPTAGIEFPLQVLVNGIPAGTAGGPLFQVTNLPAGTYDIQVIDANGGGCPSNVVTVTLTAPMFGPEVYWPGGLYQDPALGQATSLLDDPLREAAEKWLEEGPVELPPERWSLSTVHELRPAVSLTIGGPLRGNWQWRWTGGWQEGHSLGYIAEMPGTTLSAGFESWFQNGNLRYLPKDRELAPFIGGGMLWQQIKQEPVYIDGFGPAWQSGVSSRNDNWLLYLQAGYRWQPSTYLQVELEGRWGGKKQLYLIPRIWVKF